MLAGIAEISATAHGHNDVDLTVQSRMVSGDGRTEESKWITNSFENATWNLVPRVPYSVALHAVLLVIRSSGSSTPYEIMMLSVAYTDHRLAAHVIVDFDQALGSKQPSGAQQ